MDTVAVITGGTTGMGLATARRLVKSGGRVVVMGRSADKGKAAVAELGPRAAFVPGDVTDDDDVARLMDTAAAMGELRIVVCCAGHIYSKRILGKRLMRLDEFQSVVQANLVGTFNTIRHAVPRMAELPLVEEDRGVVITTSSIAAWDGQSGLSAYAAAKAAVAGMTLPLARELAEYAIRVVSIAPGLFGTAVLDDVPERALAALSAKLPHPRRFGQIDEFAGLAEHVIENTMLNGESIRLDAALRM